MVEMTPGTLSIASSVHQKQPAAKVALNEATRAWINAYTPGAAVAALPGGPDIDTSNILHAADIWYSINKYWCKEAQRVIRARRGRAGGSG
ncbi:MAG TPA: hypothetical protein VJM14_15520 [Burkholderiales bacterium]|nr:hypothetical protein [Burkholderiales bacterium]